MLSAASPNLCNAFSLDKRSPHPRNYLRPPAMSFAVANKRLLKEYKDLIREAPDGICAGPIDEDNLLEWECFIRGPDDTPFEGGVFPATLSFPKVCSLLWAL